jgi:hypothetical protein
VFGKVKFMALWTRSVTGCALASGGTLRAAVILCTASLIGLCPTHGRAMEVGQEPVVPPAPERLRLITSEQYLNTLTYIFGADLKVDPHFPPLRRTDGLIEDGAAIAGVGETQLEQYQRTAATVAAKIVSSERRSFLMPCKPKSDTKSDRTCAAVFLSTNGRYLYRRPLMRDEVNALVDTASSASDRLKDFYAGLSIAVEGMLLDPEVLYITEQAAPDPRHPGHERLDAYSLASRLSFFLWNAAPDDQLLKAAQTGEILTDKGRARVVQMMLASPRLVTGMRAFFDDMLGLDDFATLAKDPYIYPGFTGVTATDAREQTLRTITDHLITKDLDYRDLFTTRETFISPALAVIYGLPAPPEWAPYEFPEGSARTGLLTQIAFLAGHAHPGRSSPTLRGKALRELLLCEHVPRPPPNVDFSKVENPDPSLKTMRQRLTAHRSNPVCAGCHRITDPIGLSLENFDGAGQYRATEHGAPIDASGTLDGRDFSSPAGLGQALHDDPALSTCLVQRVYAYGVGHSLHPEDKPLLDYFTARFKDEGYRLPDLLRSIALSDAFSAVATAASAPATHTAAVPAAASTSKQEGP